MRNHVKHGLLLVIVLSLFTAPAIAAVGDIVWTTPHQNDGTNDILASDHHEGTVAYLLSDNFLVIDGTTGDVLLNKTYVAGTKGADIAVNDSHVVVNSETTHLNVYDISSGNQIHSTSELGSTKATIDYNDNDRLIVLTHDYDPGEIAVYKYNSTYSSELILTDTAKNTYGVTLTSLLHDDKYYTNIYDQNEGSNQIIITDLANATTKKGVPSMPSTVNDMFIDDSEQVIYIQGSTDLYKLQGTSLADIESTTYEWTVVTNSFTIASTDRSEVIYHDAGAIDKVNGTSVNFSVPTGSDFVELGDTTTTRPTIVYPHPGDSVLRGIQGFKLPDVESSYTNFADMSFIQKFVWIITDTTLIMLATLSVISAVIEKRAGALSAPFIFLGIMLSLWLVGWLGLQTILIVLPLAIYITIMLLERQQITTGGSRPPPR